MRLVPVAEALVAQPSSGARLRSPPSEGYEEFKKVPEGPLAAPPLTTR